MKRGPPSGCPANVAPLDPPASDPLERRIGMFIATVPAVHDFARGATSIFPPKDPAEDVGRDTPPGKFSGRRSMSDIG